MDAVKFIPGGEAATVGDIVADRKHLVFYPEQYIKIILAAMQGARTGCAGVLDENGYLQGMLTEQEILRYIFSMLADPTINPANLGKRVDDMTVADVMIEAPRTLNEETDIEEALDIMNKLGFRCMPVVRDHNHHLIGLVDEREVAIHVRNRLTRIKREAAEKEMALHWFFGEPYGMGYSPQLQVTEV